jgi:hypothetical protein
LLGNAVEVDALSEVVVGLVVHLAFVDLEDFIGFLPGGDREDLHDAGGWEGGRYIVWPFLVNWIS